MDATPRWLTLFDITTRDFAVSRDGIVIDHVRTYLEAEELQRDFETWVPEEGETPDVALPLSDPQR